MFSNSNILNPEITNIEDFLLNFLYKNIIDNEIEEKHKIFKLHYQDLEYFLNTRKYIFNIKNDRLSVKMHAILFQCKNYGNNCRNKFILKRFLIENYYKIISH